MKVFHFQTRIGVASSTNIEPLVTRFTRDMRLKMVTLITGGNDNGKSEYAEDLVLKLSPGGTSAGYTRLYLATMSARDDESLKRIEKHILRRKDMEYITIEKSCDIGSIDLEKYGTDGHNTDSSHRILLIEDIPNLLAGEMFQGKDFYPNVSDKIINDIKPNPNNVNVFFLLIFKSIWASPSLTPKYVLIVLVIIAFSSLVNFPHISRIIS